MRVAHKRLRPLGADPRSHEPREEGDHGRAELEALLKERFGGAVWYCTSDIAGFGADLCAGYSVDRSGRLVLTGLLLLGEAITADMLRKVSISALENAVNLTREGAVRTEVDRLPPLRRMPEQSPEAFSQLVARHYKTWASVVPHPAAAMAADAEVKLATVHSWIREARLRGLLPHAQRAKGRR